MGNISSADSTRRLEDEFFTPSDMIGRDIIVDKVTKKDKLVGKIELTEFQREFRRDAIKDYGLDEVEINISVIPTQILRYDPAASTIP